MKTMISKKQLDDICKSFLTLAGNYEKVKKSDLFIEIFNGFITLSVKGKYQEYTEVIDGGDNCSVKGFSMNPL